MLSDSLLTAYREDGFMVIPDVFSAAEVTELRRVTDEFVGDAARVSANDDVYDLEDTHSTTEPRVRRIKTPHLHHTAYARASRHPTIVGVSTAIADQQAGLGGADARKCLSCKGC